MPPEEAQPGCIHKQQGSTSGGDFERPKAAKVYRVRTLGTDSTILSEDTLATIPLEFLHTPLVLLMRVEGALCAQGELLWCVALGKAQRQKMES